MADITFRRDMKSRSSVIWTFIRARPDRTRQICLIVKYYIVDGSTTDRLQSHDDTFLHTFYDNYTPSFGPDEYMVSSTSGKSTPKDTATIVCWVQHNGSFGSCLGSIGTCRLRALFFSKKTIELMPPSTRPPINHRSPSVESPTNFRAVLTDRCPRGWGQVFSKVLLTTSGMENKRTFQHRGEELLP